MCTAVTALLLFLVYILRSDENPDVLNEGAINRGQIQMSTGMEKEEEGEVHIAKAMAQTMFAANAIVVPIPESKILEKPKQDVKMTTFKMPKQYVRTHKWMLEDEKVPCYDMDTDDEQFLDAWNENSSNTKNKLTIDTVNFERIMDRVEMAQGDATDPKGMGETLGYGRAQKMIVYYSSIVFLFLCVFFWGDSTAMLCCSSQTLLST